MIQKSASNNMFYLVDASGFLFRSFFALPALTNSNQQPVGALLGLCNMLLKLWESHDFTHWALVLDSPSPTFRHDLMPSYKSQRKTPPDALIQQFQQLPLLCESFSIPYIIKPGFEADDLMVSYAKWGLDFAQRVCLVSSDKDLMQAVTPNIVMYDPVKELWVDEAAVELRWGVAAKQIPDVQALAGDASDHIPGIPGVGPKTAALWVKEAGNLEKVLKGNISKLSNAKRELIETYQEQARLCYHMVRLIDNVPIVHTDGDAFKRRLPNAQVLSDFVDQMELKRVKRRLMDLGWIGAKPSPVVHVSMWADQDLCAQKQTYIRWIQDKKDNVLGAMLGHGGDVMIVKASEFSSSAWHHFWNNPEAKKVLWDIPFTLRTLHQPMPVGGQDLRLLEYIGQGCHSSISAKQTLTRTLVDVCNIDITWENSIPEALKDLEGVQEAYYGLNAYSILYAQVCRDEMASLYSTLDMPCISRLYAIEERGIYIDKSALADISAALSQEIARLEESIYTVLHKSINLSSPKQLAKALFEDLQWPVSKKGKSGQYSTDSSVLEEFAQKGYRLAQDLLDWRHCSKLKQSYTETLPLQIRSDTGRIHCGFSMVTTSTGRLSSFNPNLQQIPLSEAFPIRSAFKPAPGYVFLSLDYSQIELRLLAHMGNITSLIEAFRQDYDVHEATAKAIFTTPYVTAEQRKYAKTINFGILYGMSAFGLAKQLHISTLEASTYIKRYFELYPGVQTYMKRVEKEAEENGFVHTLWGRKCSILDIHSSSSATRQGAKRQAINAPLQGTCADFMKQAILGCTAVLKSDMYLLLQIHDELLFEIPETQVDRMAPLLQKIMEEVAELSVPLKINMRCSKTWGG